MARKLLLFVAVLALAGAAFVAYSAAAYFVIWSPAEEVSIESAGTNLSGTLAKPVKEGVFPGVVLLHGAGPGTRSDVSYRVHGKAFLRAGFAVLLYDKRGSGASGGDFAAASYADFIADAVAAAHYLAARPDIDATRIGLVGASESGWFTPEIAQRSAAAFVINKVGPPLSWVDTVLWEVRNDLLNDGARPADLEQLVAVTERVWEYMLAASADPAFDAEAQKADIDAEVARAIETVPEAERLLAGILARYRSGAYADFAARAAYDPRPFLEDSTVPMLYIFGEHDINVPTAASAAYLHGLRDNAGKDITVRVYPGVGHTLYSWLGLFRAGYPAGYLEFLGEWARTKARLGAADEAQIPGSDVAQPS